MRHDRAEPERRRNTEPTKGSASMGNGGFGSDLWKNVQAVKLGRHGGIEAPVRANSRQGIVLGQDAVAKSDAAEAIAAPATDRKARRRWSRLFRR